MDDIFCIFSNPRPSGAIKNILSDFSRIYTWSIQRQMIFDASKFNLVNCFRRKRLRPHHKSQVCFGPVYPDWVREASLLGVILDSKLSFRPELERIAKKVKTTASFRVYNHVDENNGLCVARLLEKFTIWVEPIYAYGSSAWIFKVFPHIRLNSKPSWGYDDTWSQLSDQYKSMMRACAAVPSSTNFNAVLVRLGVMPLHYRLGLRAMSDFYRIQNDKAGEAMTELLSEFRHLDSDWENTYFLAPAENNISYFENYSDKPLLRAPSCKTFLTRLRKAMFNELSVQWSQQQKAKFTRSIIPTWKPFDFSKLIPSKRSEVWMMRCCFAQNFTRTFKRTCNLRTDALCRGCRAAPETIDHIILECPVAHDQRENLKNEVEFNEFNLQNILGTAESMRATLKFISGSKLDTIFV